MSRKAIAKNRFVIAVDTRHHRHDLAPPHLVQRNDRLTFEKGVSGPQRMISGATAIGA